MAKKRKIPVDENGVALEQPFVGYIVHEKLETGTEYTSWAGRDERLDREVIIKEINLVTEDREGIVEEFFSESGSVARIKHPQILRAIDTGRVGNRFFMVWEYPRGESLKAVLEAGSTIGEERALCILEDITRAIDHLYEQGIVHDSIDPSSILLSREGTAILCDVGFPLRLLYKNPTDRAERFPWYSPPEQFDETDYTDTRSDLYSLGSCFYHMLTGRAPVSKVSIDGSAPRPTEDGPPSPRNLNPAVSAASSALAMSLIAFERSERPGEPSEVIEKILEHPLMAERAARLEQERLEREAAEAEAEEENAESEEVENEEENAENNDDSPED